MEKLKILKQIKELYENGENVIKFLKSSENEKRNSLEQILISYDFQAGSYIRHAKENPIYLQNYTKSIAKEIINLGSLETLLEVGIGEATTLRGVLKYLDPNTKAYGLDLSWSRIKYAKKYLEENGLDDVFLMTGDLFHIPLRNNSIDVVYTSHSIEPNGGKEKEALIELYRVAKKFVVLLEPSFEFGSEEARERMLNHGYVTCLYQTAINLGYKVISHSLFGVNANPLNPTGIIIIKKNVHKDDNDISNPLCCPNLKSGELIKLNQAYFSKESLLVYPIINNIPCLLPQNAIIATHFED